MSFLSNTTHIEPDKLRVGGIEILDISIKDEKLSEKVYPSLGNLPGPKCPFGPCTLFR